MAIAKRLAAEFIGTALLLAIGGAAGIAAQRLAGGDAAMALLISALIGAMGLALLILTFGTISGGLFNPVLTLSEGWRGNLRGDYVAPYIVAQAAGAVAGVAAVHGMYGLDLMMAPQQARTGSGQWLGEFVATFGLVCVFIGCGRARPVVAPFAVSAYVMAACWFSSSLAFMNPALTLSRCDRPGRHAAPGRCTGLRAVATGWRRRRDGPLCLAPRTGARRGADLTVDPVPCTGRCAPAAAGTAYPFRHGRQAGPRTRMEVPDLSEHAMNTTQHSPGSRGGSKPAAAHGKQNGKANNKENDKANDKANDNNAQGNPLDEALDESFPASDPVAISITAIEPGKMPRPDAAGRPRQGK
jgi:glycerol uptake facilitator-like aquaporin